MTFDAAPTLVRPPPRRAPADVAVNAMVLAALGGPLVTAGFALYASFAYDPAAIARQEHLAFLGVRLAPCPGCVLCGMSRAFAAFAHGEFSRALAFNPGVVVFFPLFCLLLVALIVGVVRLVRNPICLVPPRRLVTA
ncbi:MAG: DUF2752 domain-containing protein [Polyangiaceae bacterium]